MSFPFLRIQLNETEKYLTEERISACKQLCREIVPGWSSLSNDDININRITGGLTNILTKASISTELASKLGPGILSQVLIRHFGQDTEKFFDRKLEGLVFEACASCGVGPRLIATFEGGRIEEFLDARTLMSTDCAEYINQIAAKLAEIHHLNIKELPKEPSMFQNLEKWLNAASKVSFGEDQISKRALLAKINLDRLALEVTYLKKVLLPLNPIVKFCHNDFLASNIMIDVTSNNLLAIDFEYGSYNYRSYDIANHFCEWVVDYMKPEYPKFEFNQHLYPTEYQQKKFYSSYLMKYKQLDREANPMVTEDDIDILKKEVNLFLPVPHLMWGLWGIVQAEFSNIDFGYMEFAVRRIEEYFWLKEKLIAKY